MCQHTHPHRLAAVEHEDPNIIISPKCKLITTFAGHWFIWLQCTDSYSPTHSACCHRRQAPWPLARVHEGRMQFEREVEVVLQAIERNGTVLSLSRHMLTP